MSKNVPTDEKLWSEIQTLAKGERKKPVTRSGLSVSPVNEGKGFVTFPSAYANGWALAQYKRLGGKWKKESKEADQSSFRVAYRHLESAKRDDPKMKNTGKGGLDTWFSGHGGGKPDERATWGDWVAITPVKHKVEDKTYDAGDIVGLCAVSSTKEWSSVTDGGKRPLKCMPRDKAHDLTKEQRATLARKKRKEEAKHTGQKPVNTPTFNEEGKKMTKKKADFYRQVSAPDSLSSLETGTPISKSTDGRQESSSLPTGDTARNIGRPSPDSPNLKYRNLDRSESNGRTPANKVDFGYVHDSGSGSARVIPYDSGFANNSRFANNSSALRTAHLKELVKRVTDTHSLVFFKNK